tara:strand:- start:3554 stop:4402 length:849 start_codon:yes stop_codon:yes gene_type:complete
MSFNYLAALSCIECKNLYLPKNSTAIDLGCQTPSISIDNIIEFLQINKKKIYEDQIFNLKKLKETKFSTYDFFKSLNYLEYKSIDINGALGSFHFDLNFTIQDKYNFHEQYDLVINNGTGEHIFNQYSFFNNFHNLTKKNGYMLNILPFIDWINHGFYNFNPIIFADMAASNNYEIIKISLANRWGSEIELKKEEQLVFFDQIKPNDINSNFNKLINIAKDKLGSNIIIKAILKKNGDSSFQTPLQGKYIEDVKNFNLDYSRQKKGSAEALGQISDGKKREN